MVLSAIQLCFFFAGNLNKPCCASERSAEYNFFSTLGKFLSLNTTILACPHWFVARRGVILPRSLGSQTSCVSARQVPAGRCVVNRRRRGRRRAARTGDPRGTTAFSGGGRRRFRPSAPPSHEAGAPPSRETRANRTQTRPAAVMTGGGGGGGGTVPG